MKTKQAFTLIELLIVVAIIAILAAIAVPNFLEAQVRAKVAASKASIRSIVTALESYRVDYDRYPFFSNDPEWMGYTPYTLSTPLAYMTMLPQDVFAYAMFSSVPGLTENPLSLFQYDTHGSITFGSWHSLPRAPDSIHYVIMGVGPDLTTYWTTQTTQHFHNNVLDPLQRRNGEPRGYGFYYDPTNGTVSDGDILYYGPGLGFEPSGTLVDV